MRSRPWARPPEPLYVGGHAVGLGGCQAQALLDELFAFATQDRFIYSHAWRQGDLVIWDNRCGPHRATPFDRQRYKRDCRRTAVNEYGDERIGTTEVQAA